MIQFDFAAWRARNPLRAWMDANSVSQSDVAAGIGAGVQAVQRWLSGASMPGDQNIAAMARMIGTEPEKLRATWETWKGEPYALPVARSDGGGNG